MSAPAPTYDFPWGTRPICPNEHEQSIGGDGYGGRCSGTMDVPTIQEASPDCPRGLCEGCCDDTCCHGCHLEDCLGDDPLGPECLMAMAEEYAERDRVEERGRLCCSNRCGGYCEGGQ